jgi:hypothetical protein
MCDRDSDSLNHTISSCLRGSNRPRAHRDQIVPQGRPFVRFWSGSQHRDCASTYASNLGASLARFWGFDGMQLPAPFSRSHHSPAASLVGGSLIGQILDVSVAWRTFSFPGAAAALQEGRQGLMISQILVTRLLAVPTFKGGCCSATTGQSLSLCPSHWLKESNPNPSFSLG